MTGADHSYQTDETYTYDSNGNRTMTGYDTGPNNQLLDDGTYTYEYDDEGNRIRREKTSDGSSTEYEWDFRNRLVRVTDKDSMEDVTQVVEYTYDVFDRRIARAHDTASPFDLDDAAIERYVLDDMNGVTSLDGGNVVLDFVDPDGDGQDPIALARRYLFSNHVDQLLAQENIVESPSSADRVLWPLIDHLQTVRNLYSNDASASEQYEYDSFGAVISGDTSLTRYLFTSREIDTAAGGQYNRTRWYDAPIGIWLSEDPIKYLGMHTHLYGYVQNGPIAFFDPTGYLQQTTVVDPTRGSPSTGQAFDPFTDSPDDLLDIVKDIGWTYLEENFVDIFKTEYPGTAAYIEEQVNQAIKWIEDNKITATALGVGIVIGVPAITGEVDDILGIEIKSVPIPLPDFEIKTGDGKSWNIKPSIKWTIKTSETPDTKTQIFIGITIKG